MAIMRHCHRERDGIGSSSTAAYRHDLTKLFWEHNMSLDLANAVAKRFIARADAKARQGTDGEYRPVRADRSDPNSATIPWSRDDVLAHLDASKTYGHYFLDHDNTTKLFAFDIDLEESAKIPIIGRPGTSEPGADPWESPHATDEPYLAWEKSFTLGNPREAWRNRGYAGRNWMKMQFRSLAGLLASSIHNDLGLEVAVAYSGNKGVHVYGFTNRCQASEAREGADLVIQMMGDCELRPTPTKRYISERFPHLGIEVYPKQDTLPSGGFGNLMRLPLGRNLKSPDPTFFIDLRAPLNEFVPVDPLWSLTDGAKNPWADQ